MKKYLQTKNLRTIFDLSTDYFESRQETEFFKGIHYFIPPNKSKTKKAVLWDIEAVDNWIRSNNNPDTELQELLNRK